MSLNQIKHALVASAAAVAVVASTGFASAAATTKTLSTNYTLVNLGSSTATVSVNYYKDDGSSWAASASSTGFTVAGNGGQAIIAQYFDAGMSSGRGSAVVASDQPMGAVVQILARAPQVPTYGAYIGSSSTDVTYYVPLVMRKLNGASSQVMIQNAGTTATTVSVQLIKAAASPGSTFTKSGITIQAGATYYYDLSDEAAANVADGWYGSAVVGGGGQISVISNLFAGADQLQTFNGFMSTQLGSTWFIPLFASRLSNALSTPVSVQNLSGSSIAAGGIVMNCTKDAASAGNAVVTASNASAVGANESYFFNPVTDTSLPTNWFGSCSVTAPGNVAVFVQMRQPGVSVAAAAYEAINAAGTNKTVLVPLVAKLLSNGFATPVTIQNLGATATTVNITYTPSSACTGCATFTETGVTIQGNSSLIRNFRLAPTVAGMPSGWYGTMKVVSATNAIDGFVQLTTVGTPAGDTLMAHGVFTLP